MSSSSGPQFQSVAVGKIPPRSSWHIISDGRFATAYVVVRIYGGRMESVPFLQDIIDHHDLVARVIHHRGEKDHSNDHHQGHPHIVEILGIGDRYHKEQQCGQHRKEHPLECLQESGVQSEITIISRYPDVECVEYGPWHHQHRQIKDDRKGVDRYPLSTQRYRRIEEDIYQIGRASCRERV